MCLHLPFKTTTDDIVAQKNIPGQSAELTIANATVTMKTITSMMILHTIRGVKLPLKCTNTKSKIKITFDSHTFAHLYSYPKFTKILIQLKNTFGICEAKPMYVKKYVLYSDRTPV